MSGYTRGFIYDVAIANNRSLSLSLVDIGGLVYLRILSTRRRAIISATVVDLTHNADLSALFSG